MSGAGRPASTLRLVLGDQLSPALSALSGLDPARDVVLMAEVMEECSYVPHHPRKIALVLAAMRHFAAELAATGVRVDYVRLEDPANSGSLVGELGRAIGRHRPARVVMTEPGEWRLRQAFAVLGIEVREDDRFLCSHAAFAAWAGGRRALRMEFFYRAMRRRRGLLMEGAHPAGGRWNFDAENRKRLPARIAVPPVPRYTPDAITAEVLALVARRFGHHFGRLEGFSMPVTRVEAEAAFADFLRTRLASFGAWQDAMSIRSPFLFHSLLSSALNLGLLDPGALCRGAEAAWRDGAAPLAAVEGFVRQILGWREFVRGVYWRSMPGYGRENALAAHRPLPAFYWTGETEMACMARVIRETRDHGYSHHIQRLMITGNFALLAGIDPDAVERWYLAVYTDAYEWVEMPNTRGMALFADGGIAGSKPYAASGAYVARMGEDCAGCPFDVRATTGARACPFNFLYWDFIARHGERFRDHPRMALPLMGLARMAAEKRAAIAAAARQFLAALP